MKIRTATLLLAASGLMAQADPQLTSWFTVNSGKTAAIYRTDAEKFAGTPETTWSNGRLSQSRPAYDGVQEFCFHQIGFMFAARAWAVR